MKVSRILLLVLSAWVLSCSASAQTAPKITIRSELAKPVVLENTQEKNYIKVSLTGFGMDVKKRSPINLALVIDRSSSMRGDRIEKAREAAIMAVNMLEEGDILSVVTYDSAVELIVPAGKVKDKQKLIEAIQQNTTPRGMTALFAGLSRGIAQASQHLAKERINRIILLSDGQANIGPTSQGELSELAKIAARKGIAITTLGIGDGYNEDLMAAIAGYSDGNHAFVQRPADLEAIFVKEFSELMSVVAQNLEVHLQLADNVTPLRLLGRDGEIKGNKVRVRLNQLYSNQEKYVLLEIMPPKGVRAETKPLVEINVSYENLGSKQTDSYEKALALRYSHSAEETEKAAVEEVLADSATQLMALENERAIRLIDEGKPAEAQAVLRASSKTLEALPVSKPETKKKIQANLTQNQKLIERMGKENKASTRKALREHSYNTQKQNTSSAPSSSAP